MSKLSNCLMLLSLLQGGKVYSISKLSEELEVSPRMIRQYKAELEMAGIYISSIRGPYGGYVLEEDFSCPSIKLNEKDVEILPKSDEFNSLRAKLQLIISSYSPSSASAPSDKFNAFQKAIKQSRRLKITYTSSTGTRERIIEPMEIYLFNKQWHLLAYCLLRKEMRNFIFDYISDFTILDEKF